MLVQAPGLFKGTPISWVFRRSISGLLYLHDQKAGSFILSDYQLINETAQLTYNISLLTCFTAKDQQLPPNSSRFHYLRLNESQVNLSRTWLTSKTTTAHLQHTDLSERHSVHTASSSSVMCSACKHYKLCVLPQSLQQLIS